MLRAARTTLIRKPNCNIRCETAQDFDLPVECNASGELQAVHDYLGRWEARESWKKSYYSPELVIEGWKKHMSS